MFRTITSICILMGCLLLVNKWLHESVERDERRARTDDRYSRVDRATANVDRFAAQISRHQATSHPVFVAIPIKDVMQEDVPVKQQLAAEPGATTIPPVSQMLESPSATATAQTVKTAGQLDAAAQARQAAFQRTTTDEFSLLDIDLDELLMEDLSSDEGAPRDASGFETAPGNSALFANEITRPDQIAKILPVRKAATETRRDRLAIVDAHRVVATSANPPLTPEMAALQDKLQRCLRFYFDRPLNSRDDSAWSVMHSFLGFGVETPLRVNGPEGRTVNAIGWMCWNRACAGRTLLYISNDQIHARQGPGYEGHPGQFLAMLAQSRVPDDYPIKVSGQELTVADLIQHEKLTCRSDTELTFKLIGLVHYLDSNEQWQNDLGKTWNISNIVRHELAQKIHGAACGGTHRMMAISYAVRKREQRDEPVDGQWLRAKKFMDAYHEYTFKLQNPDGSFSSDWFRGRGNWGDIGRKFQTTGHILEWLVYSLPEDQLYDQRTLKAVNFLVDLMIQNRYYRWEVGPRGHSLRALTLYNNRVFGKNSRQWTEEKIARRNSQVQSE